jgi:hypothetical protein
MYESKFCCYFTIVFIISLRHYFLTNIFFFFRFVIGNSSRATPYGRRRENHVCKVCQRSNSPKTNQIVFCDECNTPYHQLCHFPPIDRLVVDVPDAQWFCKDCQPKRRERPLETGMSGESLSLDTVSAILLLILSNIRANHFFFRK